MEKHTLTKNVYLMILTMLLRIFGRNSERKFRSGEAMTSRENRKYLTSPAVHASLHKGPVEDPEKWCYATIDIIAGDDKTEVIVNLCK